MNVRGHTVHQDQLYREIPRKFFNPIIDNLYKEFGAAPLGEAITSHIGNDVSMHWDVSDRWQNNEDVTYDVKGAIIALLFSKSVDLNQDQKREMLATLWKERDKNRLMERTNSPAIQLAAMLAADDREAITHMINKMGVERFAKISFGRPMMFDILETAFAVGGREAVKFLIDSGIDPKLENGKNFLPNAIRTSEGRDAPPKENVLGLINLLIEEGADVNLIQDGETPLHLAIRIGDIEVVKSLVEKGADLTINNDNGESPLDVVKQELRSGDELSFFQNKQKYKPIFDFLVQVLETKNIAKPD